MQGTIKLSRMIPRLLLGPMLWWDMRTRASRLSYLGTDEDDQLLVIPQR